jgi:hypothetical protein
VISVKVDGNVIHMGTDCGRSGIWRTVKLSMSAYVAAESVEITVALEPWEARDLAEFLLSVASESEAAKAVEDAKRFAV